MAPMILASSSGAIDLDVKLDSKIYGAKVAAHVYVDAYVNPRPRRQILWCRDV